MVRAAAEVLAAGDVLGGRYRLERLIGAAYAPVGTGLWRAEDLVLGRPITIRTLVDAGVAARTALFDAAARASGAPDPTLAATYDADEQAAPGGPAGSSVAYLVREWIEGEPLRNQLADGGLEPGRLQTVLASAAEAVAALHAAGGWHGRIHPDNLIVCPDGRVRLTDPGTAVALALSGLAESDASGRPTAPPALPPAVVADLALGPRPGDTDRDGRVDDDPVLLRRAQRYDTCDLGRVLYAAATGGWIGGSWHGMPAAPTDGDRPRTPRQVRAAVPRDLDAVIVRTLLPPPGRQAAFQDAAAVATALSRIGVVTRDPGDNPPRRRLRRPRRWTFRMVLLIIIILLGLLGYASGKRIGRVPSQASAIPTFATPSAGASGAGLAPPDAAVIPLQTVTAFDPVPGDGHENDDQIPLAYDGSAATAWTTDRYSSARLGGTKPGVGLLVDLGSSQHVSTVQIAFVGAPTSVELRAGDSAGTALDGLPVVTGATVSGGTVSLTANADHRYWLVWLTSLPPVSGGYRGGIAELVFRG